jgi:methylated-DNA-protein-cysteine methyltransferase-like protein
MIPISNKNHDFFQNVYDVVRLIPSGSVTSYGSIAKYLGTPRSSRMVGWAMNSSHKFDDIPAHRVVNRNGLLTGKIHFDPPAKMEELLKKEGIEIVNDAVVNFDSVFWDPVKELTL